MNTPALYLDFSPIFLKNPVCRALFSNFLQSEFSSENLLFWHAVEEFKQLTDNSKIPSSAKEIFDKYIDNNSEYAVNLGFTVVQALHAKMCSLLSCLEATGHEELCTELSALFDEAQDNIFQLMKMDPYPRFLRSEAYSQLITFRPSDFDQKGAPHHPLGALVLAGFTQEAERQDGWVEMREHDGVIVSWKRTGDTMCSARSIGIVDAEPADVYHLVNDISKRKLWDELFHEGHEVEKLDSSLAVYYMSWNSPNSNPPPPPPPASEEQAPAQAEQQQQPPKRDFVVLRVGRENKDDGSFLSVAKSVVHANVPVRTGLVRGEMDSSGFIIRRCGVNQSLVIYLVQVDPKGKTAKEMDTYLAQQRPLCILRLRQVLRKLKLGEHSILPNDPWQSGHASANMSNSNANVSASESASASASVIAGVTGSPSKPIIDSKRMNRASVYVPNTRVFNAHNGSPPPFDFSGYNPNDPNNLPNNRPDRSNTVTMPLKAEPQPRVVYYNDLSTNTSTSPTALSKPEVADSGADTTKTITRRIIGTPPSSPIAARSKVNQIIAGTPPDSPKTKVTQVIIGTPPDSPSIRVKISSSPNSPSIPNRPPIATGTDSASDTKGNTPDTKNKTPDINRRSNNKLSLTPPDSPTAKGKNASKLSISTPPDSPSIKTKGLGKLSVSSSPYSSDGEELTGTAADNEETATLKKKVSMLNLFGKLTSSSGSDDEKQSIWHRATKQFKKQSEGE